MFIVVALTHLLDHADGQALLEAAELAPVPPPLVDGAVLVGQADVLGVLLHSPLEETLAALARPHSVVLAGGVVAAHGAQQPGRLGALGGPAAGGAPALGQWARRRRRRRAQSVPNNLCASSRTAVNLRGECDSSDNPEPSRLDDAILVQLILGQ